MLDQVLIVQETARRLGNFKSCLELVGVLGNGFFSLFSIRNIPDSTDDIFFPFGKLTAIFLVRITRWMPPCAGIRFLK
jgi:hypothetical protein